MIKWLVRIGCTIGALLIVAVFVLLALGGGREVARCEMTVTLPRPAAVVFPWLVEPSLRKRWQGGLTESVPLGGGDGDGARVGARSREVVVIDGERCEMQATLTALEPPRRLGVLLESPQFTDELEATLEDAGEGASRLSYRSAARYRSLLVRLLSPLINQKAEAKLATDLDRLRTELLAQPAQPPGTALRPVTTLGHGCCAPDPTTNPTANPTTTPATGSTPQPAPAAPGR
ncbi:MAG: SRPBCC family protein [Polyangia bacterium]